MRSYTFSDYTGDRLQAMAAKREEPYLKAFQAYHSAVEDQNGRVQAVKRELLQALGRLSIFSALGKAWKLMRLRAEVIKAPSMPPPSVDEVKVAVGNEGEKYLRNYLMAYLGDPEWKCISGYSNYKGEIDALLIGPTGLFAFEVKNRQGIIHCNNGVWVIERRFNGRFKAVEVVDRGGRGPGRQVTEPSKRLFDFLKRHTRITGVYRCVVFIHPKARIGKIVDMDADFLSAGRDLSGMVSYITSRPVCFSVEQIEEIRKLVNRDYDYCHKGTKRNRPTPDGKAIETGQVARADGGL